MSFIKYFCSLCLLLSVYHSSAQAISTDNVPSFSSVAKPKKLSSAFHLTSVIFLQNNSIAFSQIGGQYQLNYQFHKKIGLQLGINGHRWSTMDLLAIATDFGPFIQLTQTDNHQIVFYTHAGPELLVGNDYAGVFAKAGFGVQVSPSATKNKGLDFGIGWGKSMAFHPNHFSWIKLFVGYRF